MKRAFALPGAQAHYAPDRVCEVEHVRIAVDLDIDSRSLRGVVSLTLSPVSAGADRTDRADRAGEIFGQDGWLELDAVELEIERVSCADETLSFTHDGQVLRVAAPTKLGTAAPIGAPIGAPAAAVIDIEYRATPRRGLYFVGPDQAYPDKPTQVWTQGQDEDSRYWFPCFDAPNVKCTSEVIATVPANFTVLSNGTCVADEVDADQGRRTTHWRLDVPHATYLITLVAAELSVLRETWQDTAVTYYVTPGLEDQARRTLGRTPEMLAAFSQIFGVPYPYPQYAQVFVADFIFGGMENTTATTLTDQVLLDERAALDYHVEDLVAHELAHQWFGDLVTCREWGQGWLNEGFATYSEYVWQDHARGRDEAALVVAAWRRAYLDEDKRRYRRRVATRTYEAPIDVFDHHLYDKGGCILHMLRRLLGDELFWLGVRHYLETHRYRAVETRDLARSIEAATGRSVDWFFEQWVTEGAGHPELTVTCSWDPRRKLARVRVQQTHKVDDTTPVFRLPAVMRYRVGGRDVDIPLDIREADQVFFAAFDEAPTQAIFDPGKHLLAEVKVEKSLELWLAELGAPTHSATDADPAEPDSDNADRDDHDDHDDRADARPTGAAAAAVASASAEATAEAAIAAAADANAAAAATAAAAANDATTDDASDAATGDTSDAATDDTGDAATGEAKRAGASEAADRANAAHKLGRRGGLKATNALAAKLASDDFWAVRAACATALADIRTDAARQALTDALSRADQHPKVRRAVARALGSFRRDEAAANALLAIVEGGDPSYFVEAAACLALGQTRSPRAPEALRKAAERDSYRDIIRQHAYLGLAAANDDSAIPLLTAGSRYGRAPGGRRAALKALSQLTRGRRDRDARDVRELACERLRDPDFRVQLGAIEALETIADPAAIPALSAMVERALDGRLRRRAREVIRALRDQHSHAEERQALADELDQMRKRVATLEQRLDAALTQLEAGSSPDGGSSPNDGSPGPSGDGSSDAPAKRKAKTKAPRKSQRKTKSEPKNKSGHKAGANQGDTDSQSAKAKDSAKAKAQDKAKDSAKAKDKTKDKDARKRKSKDADKGALKYVVPKGVTGSE